MPPIGGGASLSYENDDVGLIPSFEKKGYRTIFILYVNGKRVAEDLASQARPNQTLLSFLHEVMRLTGTKLGCAEGGCGACTVMISRWDPKSNAIKHYAVNACLMPVLSADGCHVTTVEGVGTVKGDNLHPIQKAMVDMHGSQCGFCTPGIIVALYALFANSPSVSYMEEHLDGNLCRCTGYRPIWDAARSLCSDSAENLTRGPCGTPCRECPERRECEIECNKQDKIMQEEEKKTDNMVNREEKEGMCCSSTEEKMFQYEDTFQKDKSTWLEQPNVMFPQELMSPDSVQMKEFSKPLMLVDRNKYHFGGTWFKPTTLVEMLGLLKRFSGETGGCKIVVGNTEVGIETKFKHAVYPRLIYPSSSITSLYDINLTSSHLEIGACASLSAIQSECSSLLDGDAIRIAQPVYNMLRWFASTQIRNVACLGGNLVTASPISDMNPMLACMNANLVVASLANEDEAVSRRTVPVTDFFIRYRVVNLQPHELVEKIQVPRVQNVFEYVMPYKQARRREDDISIVTSGMRIVLEPNDDVFVISDISLAFGGMAPKTVMAANTAQSMIGQPLNEETFEKARKKLQLELDLPADVPGGQVEYRMTLATSFLHKFYLDVISELRKDIEKISADAHTFGEKYGKLPPTPVVTDEEVSGCQSFVGAKKPSIRGVQKYPKPKVVKGLQEKLKSVKSVDGAMAKSEHATTSAKEMVDKDAVGKPTPHASAPLHCTGEALYTDDIPLPPLTLHGALILATQCGATVDSIDVGPATKIPGVVGVFTHSDLVALGGDNAMGPIVHDEVLFLPVGEKVIGVGQVLGIVVGETLECAESGARAVDIKYGEVKEKVVVSIEDAIEAGSFYEFSRHKIDRGNTEAMRNGAEGRVVTVSGSFRSGGQDHFYLETNSTLAVPSESDTNLTIYCSTQAPTKTQMFCASTTNTPASKVVVRMKRMGGGFGGKETRSVFASCAAAVAAKLSSRPVRLTLGRDVDMCITGGRHSFVANYEASAVITKAGVKLQALNVKLYNNGGFGFDLSGPVMDRALFHVDGCYFWPIVRAEGVVCKTAQPVHTAFRGFGGPQGMAICEHIMDHLSVECGVPGDVLRRQNMYEVGQSTPFGMILGEQDSGKWNVPTMWDRLVEELDIPSRRTGVEDFNKKHKWIKRGLALVPTKFGIAFTAKYMNQGGALVHLYTDGTVLVTHGGTEMGQGLHTKVCQVAAQAFGIPVEDVYVNDSSTDKVANTIPTAASMSTDTYGMATLDACRQILSRIEPVRAKLGPDAKLRDVAKAAHMERIDLSAHGFFALDSSRCGYDWTMPAPEEVPADAPENSWRGHPFNYFTQGVACTEVEIEVFTGNHRTVRSDILIDVGSSINPAIDIGQVEGAFIQGMGWSTIEEVVYADDDHTWIRPTGRLFTSGPGTYKIPAFNDVPEEFNVTLMDNVDNPFAVHSSKAVGEPPFFLGTSVFYAIKDAVRAARMQQKDGDAYFEMRMPATSERIRMMCADDLALENIALKATNLDDDKEGCDRISFFQPKGSY